MLREVVGSDETGRAAHALARLYLREGKSNSTSNAERWLMRAFRHAPDNPDLYVTYARIFWRSGQRDNAHTRLKQALKLNPDHTEALYWSGKVAAEEMLRALERETRRSPGGFRFTDHGIEMRDRAVSYLQRALEVDPHHRRARLLLGTVYHEGLLNDRIAPLFQDYLELKPRDPDAWFFVGLGRQMEGNNEAAFDAYARGLENLQAVERELLVSAFLLSDLHQGPAVESDRVRRFWTARDPLFLTQVNERLMEHCRRVAYTNLNFDELYRQVPGWKTDRGEAYIRYGKPGSRNLVLGSAYLIDTWRYPDFELSFGNTSPDHWRFLYGRHNGRAVGSLSSLVKRVGEYSKNPYWWEHYNLLTQVAQFRGEEGRTRLEIYYAIPGEEVTHEPRAPAAHNVNVRKGLFVFDPEWRPLSRDLDSVDLLPWVQVDGVRDGYLFGAERLMLPPGNVHLAMEVEDRVSNSLGSFRDSVRIRDFKESSALALSDLLMARRIVERPKSRRTRESYQILSNPLRTIRQSESASFYFEIYNLARNGFGATRYTVTYRVRRVPEGDGDQEEAQWSTAVTDTINGANPFESHYLSLDMVASTPGLRRFLVIVGDLESGEEVRAEEEFRVLW